MTPQERFRELCCAASITPDKPLHAVLLILFETATTAQNVASGARGLTPEGERELIKRVADSAAQSMDDAIERRLWWTKLAVGLRSASLAAMLIAAGYGVAKWEAMQQRPVVASVTAGQGPKR